MSVRRESQQEAYDVVVIGSGMGGLSAAAFLAKAGKNVLVVERHDRPGGYAHGFQRGKYKFDAAVHVINGAGGFTDTVLDILGVRDRCNFLPVDPFYTAVFPDFKLQARSGTEEFIESHVQQFPHEAKGIRELVQLCSAVFKEARQTPIEFSFWDVIRTPMRFPLIFKYRSATLADVLDEYLTDPRLKAVFSTLWGYIGLPPSRASFTGFATMMASFIENTTMYCEGGFQNLPNAFVESLQNNGGEILLREPVRRILVENNHVAGVVLENGQRIRAPIVVSNADAMQTFEEMVGSEHLPGQFMKNLRRMKPSVSAFVVYMATNLDLSQMDLAHESLVFKHWDHDETYRDIMAGRPSGLSVTVPTLVDPSGAPPGEHIVSVVTLTPFQAVESWRQRKAEHAELLLNEVETVIPGLREHITFAEGASPRTMERYTLNQVGAIYGWEQSPQQAGRNRLSHATPIRGLYLAGHWTQPNGGIIAVTISGLRAAALILGYSTMGELLGVMKTPAA